MSSKSVLSVASALACLLAAGPCAQASGVSVEAAGNTLFVSPQVATGAVSVRVTGPDGFVAERTFDKSEAVALSLGTAIADGAYRYEVTLAPTRQRVRGRDPQAGEMGSVTWGTFRVVSGAIVMPAFVPEPGASGSRSNASTAKGSPSATAAPPPVPNDQVIPDDLIVQGSTCVGLDCVNGEVFDFDTLRLKENNTRLQFNDTSVAPFPTTNWQIRANSSASGGSSFLGFVDQGAGGTSEAGTIVASLEAGAPSNSLFVDNTGRVGFRTGTPVLDLHVNKGDTPAMRFEQNGSSGFTAQTWDVAGNEANFFVRDVTSGSRLPFRIRPGAPTSSVDISANGDVGVGAATPASALHVLRTNGSAKLTVQESSVTAADRVLMLLQNDSAGKARFLMQSGTGTTGIWSFDNNGASNTFSIVKVASGVTAFNLNQNGNLTIAGTLTQNSDRNTKDAIESVDPHAVLAQVAALPVSTWHFKTDDPAVRHMGPMAQDFASAFQLGADEHHIAPVDMGGVALAAIKALNEVVHEKDAQLQALAAQNAQLARRLAAIEAALEARTK